MAYQAGDRLGFYEVRRKIGSGGMGEVYEARDVRLERRVAIKVLAHESIGLHAARRERLEREARAISKLNHPNLCSLYDVGEQDGIYYLVLELLDGTTLQEELARRSMPLKEALKIGAEIAEGLAAAHRLGIVHRDLKPGNIMLTRTGAKILDFGLARFTAPDSGGEAQDLESSPTVSRVLTAEGTAVGTPSYMAPEQITGVSVDARTDLFAFGIVLYEMIAGKPPFRGDRPAAVAAAILKQEPARLREAVLDCPPVVEHLVSSCLMKDPEARRQSAADLAQDIRYASTAGAGAADLTARPARHASWLVAAVAVVLALIAIWLPRDATRAVERLSVPAPPGTSFTGFSPALSPDGRKLAFIAKDATGDALWLHDLTTAEDVRLVDTGNYFAMFTEDGQELVWGDGDVVKSFLLRDGVERVLFDGVWGPRGLARSPNGSLLLAPHNRSPLYAWREGDDDPRVVTTIDREGGEVSHRHPQFLPDGEHFVFLVATRDPRDSVAYVGSLSEGKLRKLVDTLCPPLFADGHLFFVKDQTLWAQPFDVRSLELRGTAVPIVPSLGAPPGFPINVAISDSGVLAYGPDVFTLPPSRLLWYDRAGNELAELGEAGPYQAISLSPDGERLAATVSGNIGQDIGIVDARGVFTRVAGSPLNERGAVWSPTGDRLLFGSDRDGGGTQLYVQDLTSGEPPRLLLGEERDWDEQPDASDWDSQGRIWFTLRDDSGNRDIWLWLDGEAVPLLATRHNELTPRVSPDGEWLAFVSNESGRPEVYLQPLEQAGETRRVSHDGGQQPRWRADGRELYYLGRRGEIMVTSVENARAARETAQVLFRPPVEPSIGTIGGTFAPSPDGQRFLILEKPADPPPFSYTVIFNWRRALERTR